MTREEGLQLAYEFSRRALPKERNVPYSDLLDYSMDDMKAYIKDDENFTALF